MYPSQRSGGEHPSSDYPPHRSPAQTPGQIYSPTENRNRSRVSSISGAPHSPQYNRGYPPSSPSASRVATGPPHSHDRTSSGYYDPTMEGRERVLDHAHPRIQPRSPVEPPHPPHLSGDRYGEPNGHRLDASHSLSHQPIVADARDEPFLTQRSPPNPPRASNPMSMSNLLSDTGPSEPAPTPVAAPLPPPPAPVPRPASLLASAPAPAPATTPALPLSASKASRKTSKTTDSAQSPDKVAPSPPITPAQSNGHTSRKAHSKAAAQDVPPAQASTMTDLPSAYGPLGLTVKETEEVFAKISAREESPFDARGVDVEYEAKEFSEISRKRTLKIELKESNKRQRRRNAVLAKYADQFAVSANEARDLYVMTHEREAEEEVRSRDIEDEKERKKDMQRKRRRERTLQNEKEKHAEAVAKLQDIEDQEERSRLMKDVVKAGKKIRNTEDLLQGRTPSKEVRVESPKPDKAETVASQANDEAEAGKPKKGAKGYRPRKSKEQKLAEKESAAAGQAYIDRGDELPPLALKEEARLQTLRRESTEVKDVAAPLPYTSKGYNQIYDSIWKDVAKNNVNKAYRIRNQSLDIKQSNLRKTAQLASKEAKRWQLRTNKSTKDVQARAKRSMREMLTFWKRNERDERDQRKMAEKQELENARKAEADREANRQKRKLNFLISQTELYSHFIGKKVKTAEAESDGVTQSAQTTRDGPDGAHEIDLPDSNADLSTKVTNFEDLDFDAEDETALRQAAMANAQNAVKEAQDRARAFNTDGQLQDQFDDGEMNFQNPTSLGNMDVAQPKMLTCQLKEYQLKGLNWLVNLYEQGINGILADEMGLGKTVQSISVMAYLAEYHNIWGPFLVIAPASTLHNWQQEIAKFVPTLKVLPYWGNAKDRKILRKFWDRKHITYTKDSPFHVLVTSYQLVVQDTPYFQKIRWQYMILDEAQAIKSSQSSRWKALLGFHCRNRLLLTGTPIQNNMQELWALLHFIMPSLFDSHDEFSEWFSKDIESHAQSNTKLNEDQLRRLHMILKPFMLRRVKKHVQKELGDKVEEDVYCDLTYRQRAIYSNLRNKISFMDLIEKAAVGDDQDTATLMNLVMQFRKVCNHPDLFERAEVTSPMSMSSWAETASFMREGFSVNVSYSVRNMIEYWLPKRLASGDGRIDLPGPENSQAGWRNKHLNHLMSIWSAGHIHENSKDADAFSWLRFVDNSASDVSRVARSSIMQSAIAMRKAGVRPTPLDLDDDRPFVPAHSMLNIVRSNAREPLSDITEDSHMQNLFNISRVVNEDQGINVLEKCALPKATAPPIELICPSQQSLVEKDEAFFNVPLRRALYPISAKMELALLEAKVPVSEFPVTGMLPAPESSKQRFTKIQVPSMRRFVTDSGKLAKLDQLLKQLKKNDHRVLLYFQMTRMIDMMEEYLTYRNYKFCRLDGSTKLEDRRDTVSAFQSDPEIFIFLLSTRAGGLGINLTSADTVIFYDSDWNPTIDSQAMDRAHRLGQTKQVTVYRLITRGTIEERIRKRALQKEEVQRVVISGGAAGGIDFNSRSRENRTKDIAMWLADDDQAAEIEKKEAELAEAEAKDPNKSKKRKAPAAKKKEVSMDDMYHEGEGKFDDDNSNKPSGAATPVSVADGPPSKKKKGISKKAKTMEQRLALADGGF